MLLLLFFLVYCEGISVPRYLCSSVVSFAFRPYPVKWRLDGLQSQSRSSMLAASGGRCRLRQVSAASGGRCGLRRED
jgi:hypothetical protein